MPPHGRGACRFFIGVLGDRETYSTFLMNDDQLLRYSRHILLPPLGIEGQEALLASHVLVLGAGGLGCPAALYLAVSGVGTLTIADSDRVELSNLQRQILHRTSSIAKLKVESARDTLREYNSEVNIRILPWRLQDDGEGDGGRENHSQDGGADIAPHISLARAVSTADLVLDCSDNFATRYAVNRACVAYGKPLVAGAAVGFDGQVMVFDRRLAFAPCYHCLFPEEGEGDEQPCAVTGVLAPLTGLVGALQAAEAIKLIVGMGTTLHQRLLLIDALDMRIRTMDLSSDPDCVVCGHLHKAT